MRNILILVCAIGIFTSCDAKKDTQMNINAMKIDTTTFNSIYSKYKESALQHRRFKHYDVDSLVQIHKQRDIIAVQKIGESFQKRAIYELSYGSGDKTVMLWSQMHGDEPTATMALFDLFNFLEGKGDGYDDIRKLLSSKLNIHFIPMLNPDGAELYTRRTAQSIDMNRDARAGQTVEGALLRARAAALKPQFGFNLHDQNIYYNVPGTKNPVSISLLAPAFNESRDINEVREGAMQMAVGMNNILQQYIPDAVAKYDDTYTQRGFGDNFQSWGASTVLIESGGMKGDPEKQQIRKLNFIIILNALIEIAEGSYQNYDKKDYEDIPFNASQLHDVVLRNVLVERDAIVYKTDIAIRRNERTVDRDFFVRGAIEDIGDLQESFGYDELDAEGLHVIQAKIQANPINDLSMLTEQAAFELLKKGIMGVAVKKNVEPQTLPLHNYPIHFYKQTVFYPTTTIDLGGTANFYLADKEGDLKYAIFNGYLIDLSKQPEVFKYKSRVY
ncbi:M14 family zinc carboxypeptidase [Sphingobacterium rhinopitheci]|uniref:M14 family zinc carboxypeptidase n=1 Tax=Sphingobacterium rhinopitheci TaxID=2781960 RepID=UPI001F5264BB|nr:M14 family zinc carboxypeptidase [Sphingobacterium rhinopitheci]